LYFVAILATPPDGSSSYSFAVDQFGANNSRFTILRNDPDQSVFPELTPLFVPNYLQKQVLDDVLDVALYRARKMNAPNRIAAG
jgi:hypothetical protein